MKKAGKRIGLIISSLALCVSGAFAYSRMQTRTQTVSADAQMEMVDLLGNFTWDKVTGATGYEIAYTIGGQTYSFLAEENQANVGVAIMQAVNEAKATAQSSASVAFSVTATGVDGATAFSYTHTIDRYINFGYSSHDISEVDYNYALQECSVRDTLSEVGADKRWIPSAIFKNDLLTLGFKTDVPFNPDYGVSFFLFNDTKSVGDDALARSANYRVRLYSNGRIAVNNRGDDFATTPDKQTTNNTAITLGEKYYLSMGVFDTYDIQGNLIGETVYCNRSEYDETTDSLSKINDIAHFYTNTEISNAGIAYEYTPAYGAKICPNCGKLFNGTKEKEVDGSTVEVTECCEALSSEAQYIPVERSALVIKPQGTIDKNSDGVAESRDNYVYISSGKAEYTRLSAPTGAYYDNTDATLRWNYVEDATAYEWRVGNEPWQSCSINQADISTLLMEYKPLGYLSLSVRAVNGAEKGAITKYNVNLKQFYQTRSTFKDLTELYPFATSPTESYNVNKNKGASNGGDTFETPDLEENMQVGFAFTGKEDMPKQGRIALLRLYRDSDSRFYAGHYQLVLWGDGTVFLTSDWSTVKAQDSKGNDIRNNQFVGQWRVQKLTDDFKVGVKYYVTFAVESVYDGTTQIADRVSVRIAQETEDCLSQNTLGVVSYDFKHFDKIEKGTWIQLGASSDVVSLWQTRNVETTGKIAFVAGEEILTTQTVFFGQAYDFRSLISGFDIAGYEVNGWEYYDGKNRVDFRPSGTWNVPTTGDGVMVEPKLTLIEYSVTYSGLDGAISINPAKYTIESAWALNAPVNVPDGKVFDGWYLSEDTSFSTPITTLKGKTGNVELVARFVNGYNIKVDGVENVWKEGDSAFALNATPVKGKTFQKWQVFNGSTYVDYEGATTFTPNENMTFRSVYDWTTYSISYMVDGATHENVTSYTGATPVAFTAAKKDGYFFVGWYTDSSFENAIVSTEDCAKNLTLYAKFMENTLPKAISLDTSDKEQTLPVLDIPEGARYSVALYKGNEKLSDSDEYLFKKAGEYTLKYTVVLASGESFDHEIALTVKQVYTVTIHYGENKTVALRKYVGEKLAEADIPETPEGMIFGGLYTDAQYTNAFDLSTVITQDTNIYVKWGEDEEKKSNLGWIIGGIAGGVVLIGAGVAVFFVLKEKKKKK